MNVRLPQQAAWAPRPGWWATLVSVLGVGAVVNWFIGAGLLVVLLLQRARPYDFVTAHLAVVAGAAFIYYEGGNLTLQLSLLTIGIVVMLLCYVITAGRELFAIPHTSLTWAILAYALLSLANFGRGLLMGHPVRGTLLEWLPTLAFATTLMVANLFRAGRDLRLVVTGLSLLAYGSAGLGFYVFSIIHTRTSGIFFNAVPGIASLLFINLAFRAPRLSGAFAWMALALPLLLHQFLSFRRALWTGGIAGLLVSILVFTLGRRRDLARGTGWPRVGWVLGTLLAAGIVGAGSLELFYGQTDILRESVARFTSIGQTELSMETRSNVARLVEYAGVAVLIRESPWIGHGLGYSFHVRNIIMGRSNARVPQWWIDQNYLLIWLKQGLLGLGVCLWMLWMGFLIGLRGARRSEDPWEASWFATTAAATVFFAVFALSDWPLGQISPTFLMAMLWGGSMAMTWQRRTVFRWSGATAAGSRPGVEVEELPPPSRGNGVAVPPVPTGRTRRAAVVWNIQPEIQHYRIPVWDGLVERGASDGAYRLAVLGTLDGSGEAFGGGRRPYFIDCPLRHRRLLGVRWSRWPGLGARLEADPPDLVVMDGNPRNLDCWRVPRRCRALGIPVVVWSKVHGYSRLAPLMAALKPRFYARFDGAVCYGESSRDELMRYGFPPAAITVANNTIDTRRVFREAGQIRARGEALRREAGLAGRRILLSIGRMDPEKRHGDLLAAWPQLCATDPDLALVLVSGGPLLEEIRARAAAVDRERIVVTGRVPEGDDYAWVSACDIGIYPGAVGLAINLSLAFGKPTIIADETGADSEILRHGVTGWRYRPGDRAAMIAAIRHVLANPAEATAVSARAQALMRDTVTIENMVDNVDRAIRRALALRAPTSD